MRFFTSYIILFFLTFSSKEVTAQSFEDSLQRINSQIEKESLHTENVLKLYFSNSQANYSFLDTPNFERLTRFIKQGIYYAYAVRDFDYAAIGYTFLADHYQNRNDLKQAIESGQLAVSKEHLMKSDSIKARAFIVLGQCYNSAKKYSLASQKYNKALDYLLGIGDFKLQSIIYHTLARIYESIGHLEACKEQLYKSVSNNRKNGNGNGLLKDYEKLGYFLSSIPHYDTAFSIADSLNLGALTLETKWSKWLTYMYDLKKPLEALQYWEAEPEVRNRALKEGVENYYWLLGQMYTLLGNTDSALHYLNKAESWVFKKFGIPSGKFIFLDKGNNFKIRNQLDSAIYYYEKTLNYSDPNEYGLIAQVADSLGRIYNLIEKYKKANEYETLAKNAGEVLKKNSAEAQVFRDELIRSEKVRLAEEKIYAKQLNKKYTNEFWVVSSGVFIVLIIFFLMGSFNVPKPVIKIFGFIYFICFFEFIFMLIEYKIILPITHHDPVQTWLYKILLLIPFIPLQQKIEHGLLHFVQAGGFALFKKKFKALKLKQATRRQRSKSIPITETASVALTSTDFIVAETDLNTLPVISTDTNSEAIIMVNSSGHINTVDTDTAMSLTLNEEEIKKTEEKLQVISEQIEKNKEDAIKYKQDNLSLNQSGYSEEELLGIS